VAILVLSITLWRLLTCPPRHGAVSSSRSWPLGSTLQQCHVCGCHWADTCGGICILPHEGHQLGPTVYLALSKFGCSAAQHQTTTRPYSSSVPQTRPPAVPSMRILMLQNWHDACQCNIATHCHIHSRACTPAMCSPPSSYPLLHCDGTHQSCLHARRAAAALVRLAARAKGTPSQATSASY
jgi:hypothetical protein